MAHVLVVNLRRGQFDIYVGRGRWKDQEESILGNPYSHRGATLADYRVETREQSVAAFEGYARERMKHDPVFKAAIRACYNKRLGCWCAPLLCHAEIIVKLANELYEQENAA